MELRIGTADEPELRPSEFLRNTESPGPELPLAAGVDEVLKYLDSLQVIEGQDIKKVSHVKEIQLGLMRLFVRCKQNEDRLPIDKPAGEKYDNVNCADVCGPAGAAALELAVALGVISEARLDFLRTAHGLWRAAPAPEAEFTSAETVEKDGLVPTFFIHVSVSLHVGRGAVVVVVVVVLGL